MRSSGMPPDSVRPSNPRVSRSHAHHAAAHATIHEIAYANEVHPAVLSTTTHPAIAMRIQPTGWPIQKM